METLNNAQQDMDDHFSMVAASYKSLRTTDLEPIEFIRDRLNGKHSIEAAEPTTERSKEEQ